MSTDAGGDEPQPAALGPEDLLGGVVGAAERRLAAGDRRQTELFLTEVYRDDITGALSRRPGREQMHAQVDHAHREGSALTFVFLDVDDLKRVNDSQGHARGDELLAAVGTALRSSLRSYDSVVRYGGDEFVCALPGVTTSVAEEGLERVRSMLHRLVPGATVSAGCAELRPTDTVDEVIHRADMDLYRRRRARRHGGRRLNAVVTLPEAQPGPAVACGACGGRVPLERFVLGSTVRMTRIADCPDCGATTVIQLAEPGPGPPS